MVTLVTNLRDHGNDGFFLEGDRVIVGDEQCAVTGVRGRSVSGRFGTSVSEAFGYSKCGELGLAITGRKGVAIAGEQGYAFAELDGLVSAGVGGTIGIMGRLDTGVTFAILADIGEESGLLPDCLYRLDGYTFVPASEFAVSDLDGVGA